MLWERPLQVLVIMATYSLIFSLVYVTLIYKPTGELTEPASNDRSRSMRQKLESRRKHGNNNPILGTNSTSNSDPIPQKVKPAPEKFRRAQHEGYIDILSGEPLRLFCSSCAVVSSSGHLLNTSSGSEIDATECVFRMNNAPVRGFENDVGTRTTLRSIAHVNLVRSFEKTDKARKELLQDVDTKSDYLLINWMNRVNVRKLQDREYRYAVLLAHLYPGVKFYAFNSDQMRYAEKVFRDETGLTRQQANTWLSTGWFTMLAAMDICNEINVYGMANDDYCSSTSNESHKIPYHYYEPMGMKECTYYNVSETRLDGGHLFITEKAVFKRWASKHRLSFKHPSWEIGPESDEPLDSPFLRKYHQLMKETNYAIRSVRDYMKLEREARRIVQTEDRLVELKRGNETFIIEKEQLMKKVLELVPGARPIPHKKTESRMEVKPRKGNAAFHKNRDRDKRNKSRKKQRNDTKEKVRNNNGQRKHEENGKR
ncbi:alpha-N-acetylgalactosaminide alpha-2,6-sialyltransferase 3-like [Lytechinus variegatus]|uniref:alpha-N-acetylgalactosaminide alpha-2,6-sialyltransferase 3-like n=1 Tax=Lytechinus variegatus TaxID=7654 RepID=UPI001BB17B1C|nr:alpha-N-acetylgalactosaminide alpha-2,6-sialyltransferase 3-like [Lytechinus variegatus]